MNKNEKNKEYSPNQKNKSGGGGLSKRTSDKLERFTKNKKEKKIVIGTIIGIVLLVGVVTLYKTFALYEEKLEFNILQGEVPEYTSGDTKIAVLIDGESSNTIPKKDEGYVFESVTCTNDATAEWDEEAWELIVGNLTKSKTTCTLSFVNEANILWKEWLKKGEITENYKTLNEFLSNTEDTTKIFNNVEATNYLIANPTLIEDIKNDENYLANLSTGNTDARSDLVNIILNSTVLSNQQKYQNNLPFYIFKNGASFTTFQNYQLCDYCNSTNTATYAQSIGTSIYLSLVSSSGACAINTYNGATSIYLGKYQRMSVYFRSVTTYSTTYHYIMFSTAKVKNVARSYTETTANNNNSYTGWMTWSVSNISGYRYPSLHVLACNTGGVGEATLYLYEWYVY